MDEMDAMDAMDEMDAMDAMDEMDDFGRTNPCPCFTSLSTQSMPSMSSILPPTSSSTHFHFPLR
jgi:hypothetical protein